MLLGQCIHPPTSREVAVYLGRDVHLHCLTSGKPPAKISWILPNRALVRDVGSAQTPQTPVALLPNGTLHIQSANFSSKGDYKCIASNAAGADTVTYNLHVAALPPSINEDPSEAVRVQPGMSVYVDCVASGLPNPEVSWSLPDGTQMGKKDEGDYTCHAKNKLGRDERKVKVTVTPDAPKISPESHLLATARLGESAKFVCQATGEPRPRILWISPGHHIISVSSDRYQVMENGVLVVKRVTLADEGKYTCIARNPIGEDVKNFQMEVETQEPSINGITGRSTSRVLAVSYQTTQLDCKAEANPEPRVSWITSYGQQLPAPYAGGRVPKPEISWTLPGRTTLVPHSRFTVQGGIHMMEDGSLVIQNPMLTNSGIYKCNAKNALGTDFKSTYLQVI
uniref:Ig-like domain-containing protein n=1 Tax=Gadus morhua TaxID=8049 RepID=A0A8C5C4B2_GADMO